jgi:DNA-binding NtrC family response regulator
MLRAVKNHKLRILVVDDHRAVLLTYQIILQQQGYEVIGAASCENAVDCLDRSHFDVLLCDLGLEEGRSGFDVIDFAQMRNPNITSMLMTGYGAPEVDQQAELRGISVLYKPVQIEELLDRLECLTSTLGAA